MTGNQCRQATNNIRRELGEYVQTNGLKSLILGVSGGIDSTLCAILARPVCSELGIPLIGRSISIISNKPEEVERARSVGQCMCHDFQEISYSEKSYEDLKGWFLPGFAETPIREGNFRARLRMIILYDLAAKHEGLVLSTDNWTEMMLSFFTLHGDHCDYGMIQELWKTEVYELARYFEKDPDELSPEEKKVLKECIEADPTDGLGISDTDLDQLGAESYEEVDRILLNWTHQLPVQLSQEEWMSLRDHPVVKRHESTRWKRNWPVNIPRNRIFDDLRE